MSISSIKTGKTPQKIRSIFGTANGLPSDNITALGFSENGNLYIGCDNGLCIFDGKSFNIVQNVSGNIGAIFCDGDGTVFAGADNSVYKIINGIASEAKSFASEIVDIKKDGNGRIWIASRKECFYYENGEYKKLQDFEFKNTHCMCVYGDGKVYAACDKALLILHGKRPRWSTVMSDMGHYPDNIRTLSCDSLGYIWIGTDEGIYIYDGKKEWLTPDELDFLPKCKTEKIVFAPDSSVYIATDIGVYTVNGGKTSFLGKGRYITDGNVLDIAVKSDNSEYWIATDNGLVRIQLQNMSLAEKEAYYDSKMTYFNREDYYTDTFAENSFVPLEKSVPHITDNDGLWSSLYLGAACLKYKCTKDEETRKRASKAMAALIKLQDITDIDGFPARAYRRKGEPGFNNGDKEWYLTSDEKGELEWKGETSSDELVGHYFAAAVYYDCVADEEEKKTVAKAVKNITDHLIDHDFTLCDTDGLPTTWSFFGPDALNGEDLWWWEKGINSLELLAFLRITQYMTKDDKYRSIADELIKKHHYGMNLLLYKKYDAHSNHIDDLLGILTFLPLWKYETQPDLRKYLLLALKRHYDYEKIENNPIYAFIYAYVTGECSELSEAVKTLEDYPLDLFDYKTDNTVRGDIILNECSEEFGGAVQSLNAIPVDERVNGRLSYEAFNLKGGSGRGYCAPSEWLLGYWLGRFTGIIEE